MNNGILRVFLNVDMRNGHDGLSEIAAENDIKVSEIELGNYIVFVNNQRNKMKLYASNDVIAYTRLPAGRKIEMRVIKELPRVFNGRQINYDAALKLAVDKALSDKPTQTIKSIGN